MKRRFFVASAVAAPVATLAAAAGLLTPTRVLASWPTDAFHQQSLSAALGGLMDGQPVKTSPAVQVIAPDLAENGATVSVEVKTELAGVEAISILSEKNRYPLVAVFNLTPEARGRISTRIKMGGSGNVVGVVKANGHLYRAEKRVKVVAGACG